MAETSPETTNVIIIGCGPTGAMLSAQLGRLGVSNICLDKEDGITNDPRGIALDEDGIRAVQSIGRYDDIFTSIGQCMGKFFFVSGVHNDLHHPAFLAMDYSTSEGGTGHVGFICHKQPHLEKSLRTALLESSSSQLREQCTLTAISEDCDWIYATYQDANRHTKVIRGKYLVGADGKTGFTRKKYLEEKGILMVQSTQSAYEETWVAVNWKISLPTPQTHPDFPLWKLGYSSEDVFDLFFPTNFRFLCNHQRPAVCGRFGRPEERLWRFEFVVKNGENGQELVQSDRLNDILRPYFTHPGSRFGLQDVVTFPEDCIETLRASPFLFAARSCNKWALGRVLLSGDSAHVFPPFGGQGLASGFRDACSLAWRLKIACQPGFQPYEALFQAWYQERKQQLERSLAATVENGRYVTESNPLKVFLRDTYLWGLQLIPSWKRQLEMGARASGMCQYEPQPGLHFIPHLHGGLLLPQVYCAPLEPGSLGDEAIRIGFTDDEIFHPAKKGLLQLVAFASSVQELSTVYREIYEVEREQEQSNPYLEVSETTVIVMDTSAQHLPSTEIATRLKTVRIASGKEFSSSPLCRNRPEPRYYDELRLVKELPDSKFVVVRPDRFVFAACKSKDELIYAIKAIQPILHGEDFRL
ncbi:hypothetical protein PFICI_10881 [Pestalotiopsis fici W106-1]|uniref:FAD-binding domain-containing protein n=1 Tax=Pestalotiopsis fici (strain W106-1 / CGMCC3.15140) TaxID=1229662 RepID=W3WV35_PESFW|nr:uncharacterized protein PFICI_10881 [Pestalotiopsis fici W106-1]ETS77007.1 hypothetical protein PFICI_10881 [Pestalotiopsis fici W106-1]